MKKVLASLVLLCLILIVAKPVVASENQINSAALSDLLPPVGNAYADPNLNTVIRRVSDARNTPDLADSGNLVMISHEYSSISPFNADNSRLVLIHYSYFGLYDWQGNYIRTLPFDVHAASEPRWSQTDPNTLYYISGNRLKSLDITDFKSEVVREFSEYKVISGNGEADISMDGQHRVLIGDNREIFVYNLTTDHKGKVLDTSKSSGMDNVFITPENNVIVGWYANGTKRFNGFEMFDNDMNFVRQLTVALGHSDITRDTNGEEIMLWHNSADPTPPDDCENAVVKIRLDDNSRQCLVSFDWGLGIHISAADTGNWVAVSTYGSSPAFTSSTEYNNEILLVRLDGTEVKRLAKHFSVSFDTYSFQPKASISRDGSIIVYSSNWGLPELSGFSTAYTDEYLIDVLSCTAASFNNPDVNGEWLWDDQYQVYIYRVQENNPAIKTTGAWQSYSGTWPSGGALTQSNKPGSQMHYSFRGAALAMVAYVGPMGGKARVYLDGEFLEVLDTYAPTQVMDRAYFLQDLSWGEHTLTLEVMKSDANRPRAEWIIVDAFDSLPRAASAHCN